MGALGRSVVDRSDMLGVAHRAIDRGGLDRDLRTGAFLPALPAALAHGHCDLELRSTRRLGRGHTIEYRPAQRGDEPVVGQVRPVLVIEHPPRLAQQRERLGSQFEADDVCARLGIRRIIGPVARAMVG